jgi:hypothetical protein
MAKKHKPMLYKFALLIARVCAKKAPYASAKGA